MTIDQLWIALEASKPTMNAKSSTHGWALRQIRPQPSCPLCVGLELSTGRRGLLLPVAGQYIPSKQKWPNPRGLEVHASGTEKNALFGVTLKDSQQADVFSALAEDLARRIQATGSTDEQINAMLGGILRWQKFLASRPEGLSREAQCGLWAELHFLRSSLVPTLGAEAAIVAWQGPSGAAQDFLLPSAVIEVKAGTGKPPYTFQISSERQLDDKGLPSLYLRHYALVCRENFGESLPSIVSSLRATVSSHSVAGMLFEDRLLSAGYADVHAPKYMDRGYRQREIRDFRVRKGFPRLIERELPPGIGNVRYLLSLDACHKFSVAQDELPSILRRMTSSPAVQ